MIKLTMGKIGTCSTQQFLCYVLRSTTNNLSYVGTTNNLVRRLRQHNGEIKGGAKYTTGKKGCGPWMVALTVHGFQTKQQVLQFEWAVKHSKSKKGKSAVEKRLSQLADVTNRERWTSNSPLSSKVPLKIRYHMMDLPRRSDINLEEVKVGEEELDGDSLKGILTSTASVDEAIKEEDNGIISDDGKA